MKKFNITRAILLVITALSFISGFILILIENETAQGIGKTLLIVSFIHDLILIAYILGKDIVEDYYEERLTNIREGHRVIDDYYERKIAKQNKEIKKLKKRIRKLSRRKRKKWLCLLDFGF